MSDVQKAIKRQASAAWVKKAEAKERAEGVEKALKAGRGHIGRGAKRLGMLRVRPTLKAELAKREKRR